MNISKFNWLREVDTVETAYLIIASPEFIELFVALLYYDKKDYILYDILEEILGSQQ